MRRCCGAERAPPLSCRLRGGRLVVDPVVGVGPTLARVPVQRASERGGIGVDGAKECAAWAVRPSASFLPVPEGLGADPDQAREILLRGQELRADVLDIDWRELDFGAPAIGGRKRLLDVDERIGQRIDRAAEPAVPVAELVNERIVGHWRIAVQFQCRNTSPVA